MPSSSPQEERDEIQHLPNFERDMINDKIIPPEWRKLII